MSTPIRKTEIFSYVVILTSIAALIYGIAYDKRHPRYCSEYEPIPACGIEQVCVDRGGYVCYRYRDGCKLPPTCKTWKIK